MRNRHGRGARPPQGPGHYSSDWRRWFDDRSQRWLPVTEGQDTLVVELEDVNAASWWAALLATLGSVSGSAYSRFVGHATSVDRRWPTYQITGATFPRVRGLPDSMPPEEAWSPGMTEALAELRHRLEVEGWCLVGCSGRPWAYRYVRPRVDWPSGDSTSSGHATQPPPRAGAVTRTAAAVPRRRGKDDLPGAA
jgi:hypothetical protein